MSDKIRIVQNLDWNFSKFAMRSRVKNSTYKLRHMPRFDMNDA